MAHQLSCLSNLTTVPNLSQYHHHRRPVHTAKPINTSHFKISSSSESHDDDVNSINNSNYKFDRRKMVLGLGASNLMISTPNSQLQTAKADEAFGPLLPPNLLKCHAATDAQHPDRPIDRSCCPPVKPDYDYKLPPVTTMRTRRSAHRYTEEDLFKYELALYRMKQLPEDNPLSFFQQANIHCAYCNGAYDQDDSGRDIQIHNSWLFFPFHRWYLYFFERILGSLIEDPSFALPFWNWDHPMGMTAPRIFLNPDSPLNDTKRNQANIRCTVMDFSYGGNQDPQAAFKGNYANLQREMITGPADVYGFMGRPYCQGTNPDPGPGLLEAGSHSNLHWWVGDPTQPSNEDMGNFYSAGRDPLFYCHHANVDRMWTIWQSLPSEGYDKNITDSNYLDASFLFYDQNGDLARVKVRDCLDNTKMGFRYEDYEKYEISYWRDYVAPSQTASARGGRESIANTAPKVETVLPLKLEDSITVSVQKAKKGKADEVLVLEDITVDTTKYVKFDVYVNDEDDDITNVDKAAYAGSYTQIPHKLNTSKTINTSIRLRLTSLYDNMDVEDDDTILVKLVPRRSPGDQVVTIGGIKVVEMIRS